MFKLIYVYVNESEMDEQVSGEWSLFLCCGCRFKRSPLGELREPTILVRKISAAALSPPLNSPIYTLIRRKYGQSVKGYIQIIFENYCNNHNK